MKNRSGEKIKLTSIDELLGVVNEESAMEIEIDKIKSFAGHPFKVIDDEKMQDLIESMGKIINDIIVEACDLACWVYVCKFIEGLSLEQIVEQNRSAEQFIAALFSMFDKYIDIPDNDSNNIRPS